MFLIDGEIYIYKFDILVNEGVSISVSSLLEYCFGIDIVYVLFKGKCVFFFW